MPSSALSPIKDVIGAIKPYEQDGSFLAKGTVLSGCQSAGLDAGFSRDEGWAVDVEIHSVDMERGYLCGSMNAKNVPAAVPSVLTFWEGEIIDNKNHKFTTGKWSASEAVDLEHWRRFAPYVDIHDKVERNGGTGHDLQDTRFIFMRWKEKCFLNATQHCGLTIAGFYYICFDRRTGNVKGLYYDPKSVPFQELTLTRKADDTKGYQFGSYSFR